MKYWPHGDRLLAALLFLVGGLFLFASADHTTDKGSHPLHSAPPTGVEIIVNKSVPQTSLALRDIKYIFLGKKTQWGKNKKIHIIIQKSGSTHLAFLKKYVGKTNGRFKNYWKKLVFTGKSKSPKSSPNDAGVIKYVASTPGAIGYITAGAAKGKKVKVLKIK